jgi:hypothetical protein
VVVAVGVTLCEPEVALDVVQAALQEVALLAVHAKVVACPARTEVGAALNVTLGGIFGSVTLTSLENALSRPLVSYAFAAK